MSRDLRPTNMAEAFVRALQGSIVASPHASLVPTARRVSRAIERPGVGLIDNNATGRKPSRIQKERTS